MAAVYRKLVLGVRDLIIDIVDVTHDMQKELCGADSIERLIFFHRYFTKMSDYFTLRTVGDAAIVQLGYLVDEKVKFIEKFNQGLTAKGRRQILVVCHTDNKQSDVLFAGNEFEILYIGVRMSIAEIIKESILRQKLSGRVVLPDGGAQLIVTLRLWAGCNITFAYIAKGK